MADNSNTHEPLNRSYSSRRAASIALPRSSNLTNAVDAAAIRSDGRSQSHRLSLSPWRSRPKKQTDEEIDDDAENQHSSALGDSTTGEKKGIWRWKLMRALARIRMQRLACLFSVEVIAVQGLPASLNGLRLSATVRKKETKDGAMQTMPSRVLQGSANFEETLFIQCHVYRTGGGGTGKPLKFEPRPFVISAVAVDVPQLDLGKNTVDLSLLVQESMENSLDGGHVREWDAIFGLSGKAKGGELVLKLGIQIMEDGGVSIYNQAESFRLTNRGKDPSSPYARKQSKSSFSVTSPRVTRAEPSTIPSNSKEVFAIDSDRIVDFSLAKPGLPLVQKSELEPKMEDLHLPEFEVVDKGIEIQGGGEKEEEVESKVSADERSVSSEVVKEVVHDRAQLIRPVNLDSLAKQIKAFESMMIEDEITSVEMAKENKTQLLDAEEERVTREFLQMLDLEDDKEPRYDTPLIIIPARTGAEQDANVETGVFLSDLGQGLGAVVQTRDGGYLASMNPFDVEVPRKETPKLAMQISRPFILQDQKHTSVVELLQRLVAMGSEEMGSRLLALTAIDELTGKTAEQIAFEGIASTIINWRNKEGASSSAARSITVVKKMATAIAEGRRERILTGIWNVKEDPVLMEEILTISLQKMEAIAVEALKIQAEMTDEEEAHFDVSPLIGIEDSDCPLASAISPEDWAKNKGTDGTVTLLMIIQLRDPIRSYEAVGGPMIAVVQAERVDDTGEYEEGRLKVTSLHIGGLKLRSAMKRSAWDGEKQRLTAMQWLVAYGMGRARKKNKPPQVKVGQDSLWSISSRVMAGMWLSPTRNPDLKVP